MRDVGNGERTLALFIHSRPSLTVLLVTSFTPFSLLLGASLLVMNGKRRSRMERDTRREVTERNGRCRKLRGERTLS